eukprot:scaffold103637_cov32-Tisochrysis_lutea.AAC.1
MDGNGRWACSRGLPRVEGHRAGVQALRRLVRGCLELDGVDTLTVFAFSSENWDRPRAEVRALLVLIESTLLSEMDSLIASGAAANRRPEHKRLLLCVALSYGARQEIAHAARELASSVAAGELAPEDIDDGLFATHLHRASYSVPTDPDLVIRTGGHQRLSNFLLYQSAYAELVYLATFWPDFDATHLDWAVSEYGRRQRTFGSLLHDETMIERGDEDLALHDEATFECGDKDRAMGIKLGGLER